MEMTYSTLWPTCSVSFNESLLKFNSDSLSLVSDLKVLWQKVCVIIYFLNNNMFSYLYSFIDYLHFEVEFTGVSSIKMYKNNHNIYSRSKQAREINDTGSHTVSTFLHWIPSEFRIPSWFCLSLVDVSIPLLTLRKYNKDDPVACILKKESRNNRSNADTITPFKIQYTGAHYDNKPVMY